ncbi:MAG TPA: CopG family antitoxin [Kofleriaceae bacterium]|jgi:predicted DNA binding CopG/RHH family protein
MTKKSTTVPTRTPHDVLANEVADWNARRLTPERFEDAPDAVPRNNEARAISIRMPEALLDILKRFAEREGIGYQVLIKKWLDDRVRVERDRMRKERRGANARHARAPVFPLRDTDNGRGHYQQV